MTALNTTTIPVLPSLIKKYGIPVYYSDSSTHEEYALQTKKYLYIYSYSHNWYEVTIFKYPRYASFEMFGVLDINNCDYLEYIEEELEQEREVKDEWFYTLDDARRAFSLGLSERRCFTERSLRFEEVYEMYESNKDPYEKYITSRVTLDEFRRVTGACESGCRYFMEEHGINKDWISIFRLIKIAKKEVDNWHLATFLREKNLC